MRVTPRSSFGEYLHPPGWSCLQPTSVLWKCYHSYWEGSYSVAKQTKCIRNVLTTDLWNLPYERIFIFCCNVLERGEKYTKVYVFEKLSARSVQIWPQNLFSACFQKVIQFLLFFKSSVIAEKYFLKHKGKSTEIVDSQGVGSGTRGAKTERIFEKSCLGREFWSFRTFEIKNTSEVEGISRNQLLQAGVPVTKIHITFSRNEIFEK